MKVPFEFLAVGRVVRPHGVRGELVVEPFPDCPEHWEVGSKVYLSLAETLTEAEQPAPRTLSGARWHHRRLLLRLADCADRQAAEMLRGRVVHICMAEAEPLPPGRFYRHQLLGLTAVTDSGETLGKVVDVLVTGANDVYVVRGPQGEILLPAIPEVIRKIDLDGRCLGVRLLDGLR